MEVQDFNINNTNLSSTPAGLCVLAFDCRSDSTEDLDLELVYSQI